MNKLYLRYRASSTFWKHHFIGVTIYKAKRNINQNKLNKCFTSTSIKPEKYQENMYRTSNSKSTR